MAAPTSHSSKWITLLVGSLILYFLAFWYFTNSTRELLSFYFSNLLLYILAGFIIYVFYKAGLENMLLNAAGGIFKKHSFLLGLSFALLHFFLGLWLILTPDLSSTSRDAIAYLILIGNLKKGLIPYIDFQFSYPPAMVVVFYLLAFLNVTTIPRLQVSFTLASSLNVFLLWLVLWKSKTLYKIPIVFFFALIPFNFVEFSMNAHNDAIVITFVLLAILLSQRGNFILSSISLFVSVGLKIYPIVLLPVFYIYIMKKVNAPTPSIRHTVGRLLNEIKAAMLARGVTGRFLFVWIYCGFFPVLLILLIRPTIITESLLVQFTRANADSIPMIIWFVALASLVLPYLFWVFLPIIGIMGIWYIGKNGLWAGNRKMRLLVCATIGSLFISIFTPLFFLIPLLMMLPVFKCWLRNDDDLRNKNPILLICDLIGIIIILTGLSHVLYPFTWTHDGIFGISFFIYRVPLLMYVQGGAIIGTGILFLYVIRKIIDSLLSLDGLGRMTFFSTIICLLFFLAFRLFYPWYVAWMFPFFLYLTSKREKQFKIILLSFLFCFALNYGAYNFESYKFPRVSAYSNHFLSSDPWTIETNATIGDYSISYNQGLTISLTFPDLPSNPDVFFNISKSFSPIKYNPDLRLEFILGNPDLRDYDITILLLTRLVNGSIVDNAEVLHIGTRMLWTRNEVTYVLLPLREIRDTKDNLLNVDTILGMNILADNFVRRSNINYILQVKSIDFSYANPLIF
ncbi:MAG: hypothetical protein Q6365_016025 [Candidatus Sigynarchaeota archaeon]